MKPPKGKDLLLASMAIALLVAITVYLNKVEAQGFYTDVGFGYTVEDNLYCRKDSQNLYGIIEFGYEFDESLALQYRHNSCVGKEKDEGTLDSIEMIFRFK